MITFDPNLYNDIEPRIISLFLEFNERHPKIYELFKRYAYLAKESGVRHYGSKAIMERLRWDLEIESAGEYPKINNNWASCYARLLMSDDIYFKDFFETRQKRGQLSLFAA